MKVKDLLLLINNHVALSKDASILNADLVLNNIVLYDDAAAGFAVEGISDVTTATYDHNKHIVLLNSKQTDDLEVTASDDIQRNDY